MNDLEKLELYLQARLAREVPTLDRIQQIIKELRPICPNVTDKQAVQLAIRFQEIHDVQMSDGAALKDPTFEPWLDTARSSIEFYYWGRYKSLMIDKGFSSQVLGGLDNVTDRILGLLEDPRKHGEWDRRGMVMGDVQSGKTANYIGVVSKAADAGYRVIIIIAGLQNKLRNQTQKRVDEGFIGFSTRSARSNNISASQIGVSRFDNRRKPTAFTTSFKDFHKSIALGINVPLVNLNEPAVFVIKKNTNTLSNLIDWLRTHNAKHGTNKIIEPMLLIDDEADNASINIKHRVEEISRINGQIRELLSLFERRCYIGYTATPFANIFIDPDSDDDMVGQDLFPRDFIVSLDAPTNYFGPSKVFLDNSEAVLNNLNDHVDLLPMSHEINHQLTGLPESLCEAIRVFIVAKAIRLVRKQHKEHNSMLVNVSRFIDVQTQLRNEIRCFVEQIRSSVSVHGAKPPEKAVSDSEISKLKHAFEKHYARSCGQSWPSIQKKLHDSVSPIRIMAVNSKSTDSLDYADHHSNGLNVIAVGGLSLSRGLTLEGLTVSYFLRRSMMYDTLFQMGRWFGYRNGYEDLCRIWMPEEAQGWYEHITESIEQLRDELAHMQSINATPRDFGLKVRSHPDTLLVTARNKMGTAQEITVRIGLANQFVETAILHRDLPSLHRNLDAVKRLVEKMQSQGFAPRDGEQLNGSRLVRDVPVKVIDLFLSLFKNHPNSLATETEPVRSYINARAENELKVWDVLFSGVKYKKNTNGRSLIDETLGFPVVCQRRIPGERSDSSMLMVTNKQRVSSRGITRIGLTEEVASKAEQNYASKYLQSSGTINYPDRIYTNVRTKPLLVIHLLAIGKKEDDLSQETPVVAWSISFPSTQLEEDTVEYIVNTPWYHEHFSDDGPDDDCDDDEN